MSKDSISTIILIVLIVIAVVIIAVALGNGSTGIATGNDIYSAASSTAQQYGLTSSDNVAFNLQFEGFNRSNATGGEFKSLVDTVISSNKDNKNNNHIVAIEYEGTNYSTEDELKNLLSTVDTSKTYSISTSKDSSGAVNSVTVKQNTK